MKRLAILIWTAAISAIGQTQAVKLTPSDTKYAIVSVCASAICAGGLTMGQFSATTNISPADSWRLVYNGATATDLFESTGYTYTVYSLYVGVSQADCVAYAAKHGITIPSAVLSPQTSGQ